MKVSYCKEGKELQRQFRLQCQSAHQSLSGDKYFILPFLYKNVVSILFKKLDNRRVSSHGSNKLYSALTGVIIHTHTHITNPLCYKCTVLFLHFQNDRLPDGTVSGQHEHGYTIRRVDRYDAGRYTCTADNGVGSPATAHINLQVLCKSKLHM